MSEFDRKAAEERFRRLFAGEPLAPEPLDTTLKSAAVVYSTAYANAVDRGIGPPFARQEAEAAALSFLETLARFTPDQRSQKKIETAGPCGGGA